MFNFNPSGIQNRFEKYKALLESKWENGRGKNFIYTFAYISFDAGCS